MVEFGIKNLLRVGGDGGSKKEKKTVVHGRKKGGFKAKMLTFYCEK